MRLKDRAAIVTGAASGIGKATAQLFAEEGAKVLAVDLPGKDLSAGDANIATLEKSVGDMDAAEMIVNDAVKRFGRLDIVMNNAGVASNSRIEELTEEIWQRTLRESGAREAPGADI